MINEAEIHRKARSQKEYERREAARVLASDFAWLSGKVKAWDDLHKLTSDDSSVVRERAADAPGGAFVHLPDKQQAWDDLHRLTSYEDNFVRASAYHSLGKASIFKAGNAENDIDFKKAMEEAIGYFEKSNPLLTQKYIFDAISAVKDSKRKEKLLEVVENWVNALKEAKMVHDFNVDFLAKLEKRISDHIKESTYRFQDIFIESKEKSNQVWVLKYFSPAYFQMFLDNGNKLYISRTSGFTWRDGVYVTSLRNPYSSMMYGSIGIMGCIDIDNTINVFDACDEKGIDLYQRWITYTKGLYNYLTTTVHADWANRLLRNKFRKRFKIDLVVFHPDQYNLKYCDRKQDFWFLISDWRSARPSYSDKVNDCKPLIVVSEQFEKMGPGLIYRDLIGKNLKNHSFLYHDPPSNKGKPDSLLINDLKHIYSQNNKIIIVRP